MATTSALTVKDFLAQVPEEQRTALIHGEIAPIGNAKYRHERVKANAIELFTPYLVQHRIGKLHSETMYQVTETDALQPDTLDPAQRADPGASPGRVARRGSGPRV